MAGVADMFGGGEIATQDPDRGKVQSILDSYRNLNFVDRVLNKDKYPVVNNPDGTYSTHRMSYAQQGDKFIVYPNIVYYPGTKNLIQLDPRVAMKYAVSSGEYIPFNSEKEADWFSQNYKKVWEQ